MCVCDLDDDLQALKADSNTLKTINLCAFTGAGVPQVSVAKIELLYSSLNSHTLTVKAPDQD